MTNPSVFAVPGFSGTNMIGRLGHQTMEMKFRVVPRSHPLGPLVLYFV